MFIEKIISDFEQFDYGSQLFRYPIMKKGKSGSAGYCGQYFINLKSGIEVMPKVGNILDGIYSDLSIRYDLEHEFDGDL